MGALLSFPMRYAVVVFFLIVLVGAGAFATRYMEFILFPSTAADQFFINMELESGSSLQASSDRVREVESIVSELDERELDSFVTRIGVIEAEGPPIEKENYAMMVVSLTPYSSRKRTADEIVEGLRQKTKKLEGFDALRFQVDAGGPPVGRPITLRVVGSEDETRTRLAGDIADYLGTISGVKDVDRDDKLGKEQFEIQLNFEKLARSGLTVADVAQTVRIAYDGEVVTSVRYGEEDVDFRVLFTPEARRNVDYLNSLLVPNRDGRLIRLGKLAKFNAGPGPSQFRHYDGERSITITADVDKEIITPIEATNLVLKRFDLNRDYGGMRLIVGGEAEETQKSINDLMVTLGIAALGIYFLLILLFNSFVQPLIVMFAVPFGIIGVIIAFAIHQMPLGFLAMMGIIGLAGVVVNDSLVLVSHVNNLKKSRPNDSIADLAADGSADRLRAILMTTFTTVVGLLPLAYGLGGADPYMSPMALALGWGLLFATPLTLLLVPALYVIWEDVFSLFRTRPTKTDRGDVDTHAAPDNLRASA